MKQPKTINYKQKRDEALASMVEFKKLGDYRMAEACFNLAVRITQIRTDVDLIMNGKVYRGSGAKAKAARQGKAIKASQARNRKN